MWCFGVRFHWHKFQVHQMDGFSSILLPRLIFSSRFTIEKRANTGWETNIPFEIATWWTNTVRWFNWLWLYSRYIASLQRSQGLGHHALVMSVPTGHGACRRKLESKNNVVGRAFCYFYTNIWRKNTYNDYNEYQDLLGYLIAALQTWPLGV